MRQSTVLVLAFCSVAAFAGLEPDKSDFQADPWKMNFERFIFTDSAQRPVPVSIFEPKLNKNEKRPLVVYLHTGGGMGGPRNGDQLGGAAGLLSSAAWQKEHPCFVVSPRSLGGLWVGGGPVWLRKRNMPPQPGPNIQSVFELIDELLKHPEYGELIDPDRIYLAGHGGGAVGALATAAHNPSRFAAVFAANGSTYQNGAAKVKDLPIALVADPFAPNYADSKDLLQDLKNAGNAKSRLFDSNQPATDKEALKWVFKQTR